VIHTGNTGVALSVEVWRYLASEGPPSHPEWAGLGKRFEGGRPTSDFGSTRQLYISAEPFMVGQTVDDDDNSDAG
jgi:hypothetical protein